MMARAEIPCLRCGYDLTGLPREGVCPECALPLKETLEASTLLRSWPPEDIRRIHRALRLLAWSPTALVLGVLPGVWLYALFALCNPEAAMEWAAVGIGAGCIAGAILFAIGSHALGSVAPAKPLTPHSSLCVLRALGPFGAAFGIISPFLLTAPLHNEPISTLLIRLLCQLVSLGALGALIHTCQTIQTRTVLHKRGMPPFLGSWVGLAAVAGVWGYLYWHWLAEPSRLQEVEGAEWGEAWAVGFLVLHAIPLWRLTVAVEAEGLVAVYADQGTASGPGAPQ